MDKKVLLVLVGILAAVGLVVVGQSVASRDAATTQSTLQSCSATTGCPQKADGDKTCDKCQCKACNCADCKCTECKCAECKCDPCKCAECKCDKSACSSKCADKAQCCPKKPAPEKPEKPVES